jgi:hypothetical protein
MFGFCSFFYFIRTKSERQEDSYWLLGDVSPSRADAKIILCYNAGSYEAWKIKDHFDDIVNIGGAVFVFGKKRERDGKNRRNRSDQERKRGRESRGN